MGLKAAASGVGLVVLLAGCATVAPGVRESESARLHDLLQEHWDYLMTQHPEMATSTGYRGQNHRWTDMSLAAIETRKQDVQAFLDRLLELRPARLAAPDQLNYALFRETLAASVEGQRYPSELLPLTQLGGVHQHIPMLIEIMPKQTGSHYEDIVARLGGAARLIEEHRTLLETGRQRGVVPPAIILRNVPEQILRQIPEDPAESPLLRAFEHMPMSISEADRARLTAAARRIYQEQLRPAYMDLHAYVVSTYLPACRDTVGLNALPDGAAWYAFNVRQSTTTQMTPDEIHQLGIEEVGRIHEAMAAVMVEAGFEGSREEFMAFLRSDPQFYFEDAASLLMTYRDIAKRADPEAAKLFGKLPRLPYGVEPVPAYMEHSQPMAYYRRGSAEAGRPGIFYANTYDLPSRPKWALEALVLHEAIPGHHLQIALAQEMEGVPEFRRWGGYMAFSEGWGLYAESLGEQMGFYADPYARFGLLSSEMWRAVRLVVDTGLHSKGWTRDEAMGYFSAHTGRSAHETVVEVDRYIAWPSQALSYKIGALTIERIKKEAEAALGEGFEVRGFHDALLAEGALPLGLLETRMQAWREDETK
jgi:uncharacterized protein (DUF885 family)